MPCELYYVSGTDEITTLHPLVTSTKERFYQMSRVCLMSVYLSDNKSRQKY